MAMLITWPPCFLTNVGMRWNKSFLYICKESLFTYLHGGSGWARPKVHALRYTWTIGNPAVSLRSPSMVPPSPTPKTQLALESRLTANSPSGNTWLPYCSGGTQCMYLTANSPSGNTRPPWHSQSPWLPLTSAGWLIMGCPRLCSANFSAGPGLQCRGIRCPSLVPQHPH